MRKFTMWILSLLFPPETEYLDYRYKVPMDENKVWMKQALTSTLPPHRNERNLAP